MELLPPSLTLDIDTSPKLEYLEDRPRPNNIIHIGQRKLFLSELRFLTEYLPPDVRSFVIYVGAASGQHMSLIRDLFPEVVFLMFDGAPFKISGKTYPSNFEDINRIIQRGRPGLYLFNELFYEYHARVLRSIFQKSEYSEDLSPNVLLISDIRTIDPGQINAQDHNVVLDLIMQYRWVTLMDPEVSMLKFRLPFFMESPEELNERIFDRRMYATEHEGTLNFKSNYDSHRFSYLDGIIWPQAFAGVTSAETRLIVTPNADIVEYGSGGEYDNMMSAYNNLNRPRLHINEYSSRELGFDQCGDCSIEAFTWELYFRQYRKIEGDLTSIIHDHVEKLSRISRGLFEGGHGRLFEEDPMVDLRGSLIERFVEPGMSVIEVGVIDQNLDPYVSKEVSLLSSIDPSSEILDQIEQTYSTLSASERERFKIRLIESELNDPELIQDLLPSDIIISIMNFDSNILATIADSLEEGGRAVIVHPSNIRINLDGLGVQVIEDSPSHIPNYDILVFSIPSEVT